VHECPRTVAAVQVTVCVHVVQNGRFFGRGVEEERRDRGSEPVAEAAEGRRGSGGGGPVIQERTSVWRLSARAS
jgi:hypothetical protein